MKTAIYTLTSPLHDPMDIGASTRAFLEELNVEYDFKGEDFSDYGTSPLSIIFVRTGGTEGIFRSLLPRTQALRQEKVYLLASGKHNSLAASMEILSFLRSHGGEGEILHGSASHLRDRITMLAKVAEARVALRNCRLGIIGQPSDWLISSDVDRDALRQRMGVQLVDVDMEELMEAIAHSPEDRPSFQTSNPQVMQAVPGAWKIYHALRDIVGKYQLQGLTIRCFDLLSKVHNTGCLALAQLNTEGVVAGCEGDVPAMISMAVAKTLTGNMGFQANPSSIDPDQGEMVFAHCTIPFSMVDRYELDTHFESGIGVGIRGFVASGPVTIFKVAGDLSRHFAQEATLMCCGNASGLCRTQFQMRFDDARMTSYFLTNPIGNHHIILKGRHKALLDEMMAGVKSFFQV